MGTICKIADFSLARRVPSGRLSQDNQLMSPVTSYVSTRWYRAPEMLLNDKNISYPVDIFALGCIMAELFELTALFPGNSEVDQLHKVLHFLGAPTASHWPEGFRLAQKISVELSGLSPSKGTLHELIIAQTRAGMYTPPVLLEQQRHTTVIRTKPVAAPITPPNNGGHTGAPIIPRLSGQMEKNRPVSPWAFDLFRNLIELDPGQRLSATQALEHEYFRGGILVVDGPTKSNNAKIDHGMDSLTLCELQSLPQPCQVGTLQPSQQLLVSAPRDRDVIFDLGAAKRRRLIALGR